MPPIRFPALVVLIATSPLNAATTPPEPATTEAAYAPLPVSYSARPSDRQTKLPLATVGRLPAEATSPINRWIMDSTYYASFRDNQVGKNDRDDANAADFAAGKLKLLPASENVEVVVAVAIPNLPQTSATVGSLVRQVGTLALTIDLWQPDERVDRSKSFNAQRVEMLYLPPLPAGPYRLQIQWRVMTPAPHDQGSGYLWTAYKVAEMPFEVERADHERAAKLTDAPSIALDALRPVPMPKAEPDARTQTPWLMTARWFATLGDAKEGLTIGAGDPFKFLRGDPGQRQLASALPKLDPPTSGRSTYAMIIAPEMMTSEWASVEAVHWSGNVATIDCALWTDDGIRTKNNPDHPMLLVQLIPPRYQAASSQVTPAGHYKVNVIYHRRLAPEPGGWYTEHSQRTEQVEFDVE